jgi:hypothetical protein
MWVPFFFCDRLRPLKSDSLQFGQADALAAAGGHQPWLIRYRINSDQIKGHDAELQEAFQPVCKKGA